MENVTAELRRVSRRVEEDLRVLRRLVDTWEGRRGGSSNYSSSGSGAQPRADDSAFRNESSATLEANLFTSLETLCSSQFKLYERVRDHVNQSEGGGAHEYGVGGGERSGDGGVEKAISEKISLAELQSLWRIQVDHRERFRRLKHLRDQRNAVHEKTRLLAQTDSIAGTGSGVGSNIGSARDTEIAAKENTALDYSLILVQESLERAKASHAALRGQASRFERLWSQNRKARSLVATLNATTTKIRSIQRKHQFIILLTFSALVFLTGVYIVS